MHPLAFFWDIENCQIPVTKSTSAIVQALREKFVQNHAEMEFIVVCDVKKERQDVVEELNQAQVTTIHVNALAKNACDDKLRTSMTKFSMVFRSPGVVVLISSDVNFTQALTDLRYRCGFRVVLVHNERVSNTLLMAANEHYEWRDILAVVPDRSVAIDKTPSPKWYKLHVTNLPEMNEYKIRERLRQLSDNCGGRVLDVDSATKSAILGFTSPECATRAQKRIHGANVFGKNIVVSNGGVSNSGTGIRFNSNTGSNSSARRQSSNTPPSLTYIGQSAIGYHYSPPVFNPNSPQTIFEAAAGNSPQDSSPPQSLDVAGALTTIDNDFIEAMRRNRSDEARRFQRVLGVGSRNRNGATIGVMDDSLDFTPMVEQGASGKNVGFRRTRHDSNTPSRSSTENHARSPTAKKRVLERFAREAVELLRNSPQCRILLQRFSSTWCKHFDRPLRLMDFGCSRLTDLLEDTKDTLRVVEDKATKEKWVTLTPSLLWLSLQDQIVSILRQQPFRRASVDNILEHYRGMYGHDLDLNVFGFNDIEQALVKMQGIVEIETTDNNVMVATLIEFRDRQTLANQLLYLFIRCPERRLASWQLENEFRSEFGVNVAMRDVVGALKDFIQVIEHDSDQLFVELNQVQRMALRLRRVLVMNGGELPLTELEQLYQNHYGERISVIDSDGAKQTALGILRMASHVFYLKGRGGKQCVVSINRNFLISLKEFKPDLYIPPEPVKKKTGGHATRYASMARFVTIRPPRCSPQRSSEDSVIEVTSPEPEQVETNPIPIPKPNAENEVEISAASTPPDPHGFDEKFKIRLPFTGATVVIAGSGVLPATSPKNRPSTSKDTDSMDTPKTTIISAPRLTTNRRRLAANFDK